MRDKIIKIFETSGTLEAMSKFMGKVLDSIAGQQQYYSSKEEYEVTQEAIAKFKKLYEEKLPIHAHSTIIPLYEKYFTEEEIEEITQIQQNPLFKKMRDFGDVVGEKTEESLKEFTSEIFNEAFSDLITKAAKQELNNF